jgi:endonuclease/exonuclease/phosphatase family metal-dependent hydrolase
MMYKRIIILVLLLISFNSCSKVAPNKTQSVVVGTFNVEWLGDGIDDRNKRSERDYERLAEVIENTEADVLGLEEVENEDALKKVMKYLPDYGYFIGSTGYIQNPAVVFKKDVEVKFIENYEPLAVVKNRTRAGLVVSVKKGNFDWIMMVVHLKSTSRYDSTQEMRFASYDMRKSQAIVLKKWADSISINSREKDILIVGDFNDNPKRPKSQNMLPLIEGNEFKFLTEDYKSCANPKWDMIDHIVVNKSAISRYFVNSSFVYDIYNSYTKSEIERISDHCPVVVAFDIVTTDND